MLSLIHFNLFENIFIFREAQEFIKSSINQICKDNLPDNVCVQSVECDQYFLDVKELALSIIHEMNCKFKNTNQIQDYIFMCFFLGNDFLPHFPALNIRTHGIQVLLDIYRLHIGGVYGRSLTEKDSISWKWVNKFIYEISIIEHQLLVNEYNFRQKYENWKFKETTNEEKLDIIDNIPIIYREDEKYISVKQPYWENRFYRTLFDLEYNDANIFKICMNYIEGLEWTFVYYTKGCTDWRWKYNYHYAPLFKDLHRYIPHFNMTFIKTRHPPFSKYMQLSYVLPVSQHHHLPKKIQLYLQQYHAHLFPSSYRFKFAFKRYFWEAHCILPEIDMDILNGWDSDFGITPSTI
jgi:5'-3' exonuclease